MKILGHVPHGTQGLLHDSKARFRVAVCGRRWGKSLSAAAEGEVMILSPGTRGWVVAPTYPLTMKVIREIDLCLERKHGIKPVKKVGGTSGGPIIREYENGSWVEGKSAAHPDSLLGEGLDWLVFDECARSRRVIWEQYLRPTLTDREGWALFITTPQGYNWVYDLWKRGRDPNYEDWESFKFKSADNPHLSRKDLAEARRTMSDVTWRQEYEADFTISAGQVYKDFSEDVHVYNEKDVVIDPNWKRYRAIDWGDVNPFVCLWIAVDPQDRIWVYDEYYRRGKSPPWLARQLVTPVKQKKYRRGEIIHERDVINKRVPRGDTKTTKYVHTVCDVSGRSQRRTFLNNGIPTTAWKQDLLEGIGEVRKALEPRESDGKPGIMVSNRCAQLAKEFNLYSYPDLEENEFRGNEDPVEEYDHGLDALRYFLISWQTGGARVVEASSLWWPKE